MTTAPVLILFFNRPELLAKLIGSVVDASPARVYLACDGPRHDDDREQVEACRSLALGTPWQGEVRTRFLHANAGCARACSDAIGWFFAHEPEGIILEDDCLPDATFFRFATELLERYRDRDEVSSISGSCFDLRPSSQETPWSYRFSRLPFIWGWASWARAWSGYRLLLDCNREPRIDPRNLPSASAASVRGWRRLFRRVSGPSPSTWDYQWTWRHLSDGSLSIIPRVNLVRNIWGPIGTHSRMPTLWQDLPTEPMRFPLVHPPVAETDPDLDRHLDMVAYNHRPWILRKAWQIVQRHRLAGPDAMRLGRWW
jgi:hypothetical protein